MMSLASHAFDVHTDAERRDGTRVAYIRNAGTNVITVDFGSPSPLPEGSSELLSFLDDFDELPDIAEQLPAARQDLSHAFEEAGGVTIRSLRLRRGMSQSDLAREANTSQAAISAIENRSRKPGEDNIRDLARALTVDFNTLMDALNNA